MQTAEGWELDDVVEQLVPIDSFKEEGVLAGRKSVGTLYSYHIYQITCSSKLRLFSILISFFPKKLISFPPLDLGMNVNSKDP